MKTWSKFFAIFALVLFVVSPAQALIELRGTYGMMTGQPKLPDLYTGTTEVPNFGKASGVGGDLLVFIPLTGLGLGVRYENLGATATGENSFEAKSKMTRTAALLSYRFIDTLVHFGPIFSYGLSHSGGANVEEGSKKYDWEADSTQSYSAGLELSLTFGFLLIGIEGGYQSTSWKKMTDKNGTAKTNPSMDINGSYSKAYIGFSL